ncbi:MAG: hypothetical protein DRJ38_03915 [Thermoprotei archaeon]|nr:MAG: hypothetical protein DRJ38_03915 [Thermoprotei archaeon]
MLFTPGFSTKISTSISFSESIARKSSVYPFPRIGIKVISSSIDLGTKFAALCSVIIKKLELKMPLNVRENVKAATKPSVSGI